MANESGSHIAEVLTDHLLREGNALYPTAPKTLQGEEWHEVLEGFEQNRSCCSTQAGEKYH